MNIFRWIRTARTLVVIAVLAAIGAGGYVAWTTFASAWLKTVQVATDTGNFLAGRPTENGADLGGSCRVGADCKGFMSALAKESGTACCAGTCTATVRDFTNVAYCPAECRGWFAAPLGTCGPKRADGESCIANEQCAGWRGLLQQGSACDGGACVAMKKDWAGGWYRPSECVGRFAGPRGSCN